jgi:hypothetical protein
MVLGGYDLWAEVFYRAEVEMCQITSSGDDEFLVLSKMKTDTNTELKNYISVQFDLREKPHP